ncbi:UNVERIFIED_CONTAM: hypothetical protein K2H54_058234 [Gekko kuhli]
MSADEEPIIPITTGETTPVTTRTDAPSGGGAGGSNEIPNPFGGATAKITTRLKGPTLGRFSTEMQETWTLTGETLGHLWRAKYRSGMGGASEAPEYFLDTWLGILEQGYDRLIQMQLVPDGQPPDPGLHQGHWPTELLYATFDRTSEKLAFFVVRAQKFMVNWGHLFPNYEQ